MKYDHSRKKFRFLMIPVFVLVFLVPLGFIITALWNNILVPVVHVGLINFWQALGIFLLARLLVGGFPGGRHGWRRERFLDHREALREKWMTMSPEEREKFKSRMRDRRCGPGGWDKWSEPRTPNESRAETRDESAPAGN